MLSVIATSSLSTITSEISDVMVDKEEVAMTLNIRLELPKEDSTGHDAPALEHEVDVYKRQARLRCADVDSFSGQRPFGQQKSTSKKVLFTACIQFWVQV